MQPDIFFISYDEPAADALWEHLKAVAPRARRVHGVKGFDAAYKACAEQSTTERFFTVDGDNEIHPQLVEIELPEELASSDSVLSWSAQNSVNGLRYGNGGVKCWPKHIARQMNTHEAARTEGETVDFCFALNYFQMPETLSVARVNDSPYQAFRSGFREGIKMCLTKGEPPAMPASVATFQAHMPAENLNRLRIWCSVGADTPHGEWAMLGARLGCEKLTLRGWDHRYIRDYDWFGRFWREEIQALAIGPEMARLERELNEKLQLNITTMSAESSRFFKSIYQSPTRRGLMFR